MQYHASMPTGAGGSGYVNFNIGRSALFAGSVGLIQTDNSRHPYISGGFAFPTAPAINWSITVSQSNPSLGCSTSVAAFSPLLIGGSYSLSDGTWEWGIGSPGLSIMETCVR
jgi:hypothetical protein